MQIRYKKYIPNIAILNNQNTGLYLDYHFVHDVLNKRFYWDANENILLYTTADDVVSANAEATTYMIGKSSNDYERVIVRATADSALIDIDFVKLYSTVKAVFL